MPRRFGALPTVTSGEVGAPALERLAIERLAARYLDFQLFRQRVDDRDADAVEAAGGLIGAAVEFAARVQHRHDDFERGLLGKFRMRVDRHAAAVVEHAQIAALFERNLDEGRVASDRLVHGIVDHLGEQMVQRVGVGAANIHAGPATHRLKPLEHLDRGGGVVGFARRAAARRRLGFHRNGLAALGRARRRRDHSCRFHGAGDSFAPTK